MGVPVSVILPFICSLTGPLVPYPPFIHSSIHSFIHKMFYGPSLCAPGCEIRQDNGRGYALQILTYYAALKISPRGQGAGSSPSLLCLQLLSCCKCAKVFVTKVNELQNSPALARWLRVLCAVWCLDYLHKCPLHTSSRLKGDVT